MALNARNCSIGGERRQADTDARDAGQDQEGPSLNQVLRQANRTWHGIKLRQPDWSDSSHTLAFTAEAPDKKILFHAIAAAPNAEPSEIRANLSSLKDYPGVTGLISIDAHRNAIKPAVVSKFDNGKPTFVQRINP